MEYHVGELQNNPALQPQSTLLKTLIKTATIITAFQNMWMCESIVLIFEILIVHKSSLWSYHVKSRHMSNKTKR